MRRGWTGWHSSLAKEDTQGNSFFSTVQQYARSYCTTRSSIHTPIHESEHRLKESLKRGKANASDADARLDAARRAAERLARQLNKGKVVLTYFYTTPFVDLQTKGKPGARNTKLKLRK